MQLYRVASLDAAVVTHAACGPCAATRVMAKTVQRLALRRRRATTVLLQNPDASAGVTQ